MDCYSQNNLSQENQMATLKASDCARTAVLIVSYRNPADVARCLGSLARSDCSEFEVFICENAGAEAFARLQAVLTSGDGPLQNLEHDDCAPEKTGGRFTTIALYKFRNRPIKVRLGAAAENLGYAGGVNAWLQRLTSLSRWEAILVLNPDTVVGETCLSELMRKAAEGFGMVGGSLVFDHDPGRIINYGLAWSPITGRVIALGRNLPIGNSPSDSLLRKLDSISGACLLVTRAFVEEVGLMEEAYFLYMEEVDWGRRRGRHRIGFAHQAIIKHVGGASIGSAEVGAVMSDLAVYLTWRNRMLFSRRWARLWWVVHFAVGLLYIVRYAIRTSPRIAKVAMIGLVDGARGKSGRPDLSLYRPKSDEQ